MQVEALGALLLPFFALPWHRKLAESGEGRLVMYDRARGRGGGGS